MTGHVRAYTSTASRSLNLSKILAHTPISQPRVGLKKNASTLLNLK